MTFDRFVFWLVDHERDSRPRRGPGVCLRLLRGNLTGPLPSSQAAALFIAFATLIFEAADGRAGPHPRWRWMARRAARLHGQRGSLAAAPFGDGLALAVRRDHPLAGRWPGRESRPRITTVHMFAQT
jgi:hypothetical protein